MMLLAEKYRAAGGWRDWGSVGDLLRWRDETPEAIARLGAVVAPIMTTIRSRELERTLNRVGGASA
jgi:hypothetical protein